MNRIVRMNLDGTIISQFGAEGPKPGEFNEAIDVVLTPDKREMYVYDASNQRVQRLTLDGNLIRQWKTVEIPGRDGGRLTVDPAGQLYEASPVTKEIIVYNPENKIIAKWAQPESDGPTAVYIDGQNNLYVTYAESGVVRIFRLSPQKTS
ncbi:MAG: SMP-30/gluconolactonase/LRE family protein [Pyrinomonadaceae bacterium]